jgi:hypothetical protein
MFQVSCTTRRVLESASIRASAAPSHGVRPPHAAYYSLEQEKEARTKAAQNVVSWAREGRPIYPVVEGRQGLHK